MAEESLNETPEATGGRFVRLLTLIEKNPIIWVLLIPTLGPILLLVAAVILSGIYHAGELLFHLVLG